jgi:hypothetical protein
MMILIKRASCAAVTLALAWALPALAADPQPSGTDAKKRVYEQKIGDSYVSAYFGVNRNLGRAWVEVASTPWIDNPQREVVARKMIKGLYYDPDRKAIIYQRKGQETVCATDWNSLLTTALKTTGNCDLKVSMKQRNVDDGYTDMKEPVTTVTLQAHNLTPAKQTKATMGDVDIIVVAPDDT